jgi:transposase
LRARQATGRPAQGGTRSGADLSGLDVPREHVPARSGYRAVEVIRINRPWLCSVPVDMRCGADRLLACVVQITGATLAHHGYLLANARATRNKLLDHDGFGVWRAARHINVGRFNWPPGTAQPEP